LNALNELKESAVVAIPTEGFENYLICCAYVVQDNVQMSPSELRQNLSMVLPSYMLPSRLMALARLPKNANGKTDRRKLQDLFLLESAGKPVAKQSDSAFPPSNLSCQASPMGNAAD